MDDVTTEVRRRLADVANAHGVIILYACEAGSRAWGFPSVDSDFDVRFIYLRPPEHYLCIDVETRRDVIECPMDGLWDVNGWDLRKALRLMRKSNPPLLEWLTSPVIYHEVGDTPARMRAFLPTWFDPVAAQYHYLHMARRNHGEYLMGEEVWTKKYLYVLRPLLVCRWLEMGTGVVPPVDFATLVDATINNPGLRAVVDDLVAKKKAGEELKRGPRIPALSDFLAGEIARQETRAVPRGECRRDVEALSVVFRQALTETWG